MGQGEAPAQRPWGQEGAAGAMIVGMIVIVHEWSARNRPDYFSRTAKASAPARRARARRWERKSVTVQQPRSKSKWWKTLEGSFGGRVLDTKMPLQLEG